MNDLEFAGNPLFLVTGGAGFIGSHIVHTLRGMGRRVRVLDDLSTGHRHNLAGVAGIEFMVGSLTDPSSVSAAVAGVDYVIHQAAIPSVPRSVKDPVTTNAANVTGTLNLLVAARDAGVRRLVYASSSSVYGDTPTLPKIETMPPRPKSPYALQKLTAEEYCRLFWEQYGLETVMLRYFNVFGPRQDPTSQYTGVIAKFATSLLNGERPTIFGDGLTSRDFTFVANNVRANLLACIAPGAAAGQAMNVAVGDRITLLELLDGMQKLLGTNLEPVFQPEREGDVKHSQADVSKARTLLGYDPVATFSQGLEATVAWYKDNHASPR
ncbi:MAG TPA: SDR family oxidoreductase [Armatimonadota bacterium]|jgi:nucleoside-diphosphate-sugar epimerase